MDITVKICAADCLYYADDPVELVLHEKIGCDLVVLTAMMQERLQ